MSWSMRWKTIVDIAYKVYENQDVQLAREIEPLEEVIDELSKELKYRHIQRLRAGECTIEMGFILSDVTTSWSVWQITVPISVFV